jgi:hypothetical protein
MADESPAHVPGVRKGEEMIQEEGEEPGRGTTGHDDTPAGRPHGTSEARDDTGIDPQEPISGDANPKG